MQIQSKENDDEKAKKTKEKEIHKNKNIRRITIYEQSMSKKEL